MTRHHTISHDITRYHTISHDITRYHTISHDITRYHTISHDITRYHTISHDITRYHTIRYPANPCPGAPQSYKSVQLHTSSLHHALFTHHYTCVHNSCHVSQQQTYLRQAEVDGGCLRDVHDLPIRGNDEDETIQCLAAE